MSSYPCLLRDILADPGRLHALAVSDWQALIRIARVSNLLGRLHDLVERQQLMSQLPGGVQRHLQSAHVYAQRHHRAIAFECRQLAEILTSCGCRPVFLKGSAYMLSDLAVSRGRVFADIDVLVDKDKLPQVESAMFSAGWLSKPLDEHDSYYYRQWIHEIPPMKHIQRGTEVDIHHNIIPPISGHAPDSRLLLEQVQAVGDGQWVMSPTMMVLHSAVHLFTEGELDKGLRDLHDLDLLLRELSQQHGFWPELMQQAQEMGFGRYLFYALRYCRQLLGTPIPLDIIEQSHQYAPGAVVLRLMDWIYDPLLAGRCPWAGGAHRRLASWLAFARGHWIKMPLKVLIPHLWQKAFVRKKGREALAQ